MTTYVRWMIVLVALSTLAVAQGRPTGGQQQPGMPGPGMSQPGMPPGGSPPMDASSTSGMGQDEQPQFPQQPKVDDAALERQVHEQLATRAELANVEVSAKDGEVKLEGSVPAKEDRKEAKKLARSVPGVRWVKDKLKVNPNAGAAATSTAGAGATGQMNTGGTTGAATAGGATTSAATTWTAESQNPRSPVASSPSQRGSEATSGAALGKSPCVCSPQGAAAPTPPLPGAQGSAGTAGTATSSATAATGTPGAVRSAQSTPGTAQTGTATTESTAPGMTQPQAPACACPPETPTSAPTAGGVAGTSTTAPATAAGAHPGTPPEAIAQTQSETGAQQGTTTETAPQTPRSEIASGDVAGQIQTALRNEPTLVNEDIRVSASDDEITLSGSVSDGDRRDTAKRIADSYAGSRKVVDRLKVGEK